MKVKEVLLISHCLVVLSEKRGYTLLDFHRNCATAFDIASKGFSCFEAILAALVGAIGLLWKEFSGFKGEVKEFMKK